MSWFRKRRKEKEPMVWMNYKGDKINDPRDEIELLDETSITVLDALENHYIVHDFDDSDLSDDSIKSLSELTTNWTEKVIRVFGEKDDIDSSTLTETIELIKSYGAAQADKLAYKMMENQDHALGLYCKLYQMPGGPGRYFDGVEFGKLLHELQDIKMINVKLTIGDKGNEITKQWIYEHVDIWVGSKNQLK